MAYKALYRTYRPQKFDEVVGQETIVKALQNALSTGKITHAYLFSGPRGIGKTTIARIFAKALNCETAPTNNPCCKCSSCLEIKEGINPNVIEIDAASNNGVDEIRDIREKSKFLPAGAKYKIYIIDEVHMLSTSAFNALLKILEEPPKHVIFVLATTEPHKVLPTILSRCQRYDFHAFSKDEIKSTLRKACESEKIVISEEALDAISVSAEGGMRDAYTILDQVIALCGDNITVDDVDNITGSLGVKKTLELVNAIEEKDITTALSVINEIVNLGKDSIKVINGLLEFYKDTIIYKSVTNNTFISEKAIYNYDEYKEYANKLNLQKAFYYIEILSELQNKVRFSTTPLIYMEVSLIKMINISEADMDFSKRVNDIEEKLSEIQNLKIETATVNNHMSAEDLEKITMLEEKINHVVSELTRLELPKLVNKVNDFEAFTPSLFVKKINELSGNLSKISETVELLKVTQGNVVVEPVKTIAEVPVEYVNKINEMSKLVNKLTENMDNLNKEQQLIQNVPLETSNSDSEELYKKIGQLEALVKENANNSFDLDEVESFVEEKVDSLIKNQPAVKEEKQTIFISDELEDRLKVLEENIFKLMSGSLVPQENPVKKQKSVKPVAKEEQLALFPEEKVDFSAIQNNAELQEVEEPVVNEELTEKEKVNDINIEKESTVEEVVSNEIKEDEEKVYSNNPFDKNGELTKNIIARERKRREKVDPNADLFALYSQSLKDNQNDALKDPTVYKKEDLSPAEKALNQSVAKLGEHRVTDNSELVRAPRKTEDLYFAPYKNSEGPVEYKKPIEQVKEIEVKCDGYDVKVLERILNDSRTEEARNEKSRIASVWRFLPSLAPSDRRGIAETLAEGVINAVGKNEFVLTYPSSAICNQLMSPRFKKESLRLLYEMLEVEYDYLALPIDVWNEKRTEYVNQYNIGIKYPKLTPFNHPELVVATEKKVVNEEDTMLEKARSIFGDSLITINGKE